MPQVLPDLPREVSGGHSGGGRRAAWGEGKGEQGEGKGEQGEEQVGVREAIDEAALSKEAEALSAEYYGLRRDLTAMRQSERNTGLRVSSSVTKSTTDALRAR